MIPTGTVPRETDGFAPALVSGAARAVGRYLLCGFEGESGKSQLFGDTPWVKRKKSLSLKQYLAHGGGLVIKDPQMKQLQRLHR